MILKAVLSAPIKAYRLLISPWWPSTCRFHPTCSAYGLEAIEKYGALKGWWMTLKRIAKCHPLHKGDFHDPVP